MRKKSYSIHRQHDANSPMDYSTMQRPGIEPGPEPWEGSIIPLDYRCRLVTLSPVGF